MSNKDVAKDIVHSLKKENEKLKKDNIQLETTLNRTLLKVEELEYQLNKIKNKSKRFMFSW